MGVPVRGGSGSALGAGLQGHTTAAKLSGAVGSLAGECGHSGAQAVRAPAQLPQSGSTVPAQVVLLQVCSKNNNNHIECIVLKRQKPYGFFLMSPQFYGDQGPDPAQCCQLWFLPPDSPAV